MGKVTKKSGSGKGKAVGKTQFKNKYQGTAAKNQWQKKKERKSDMKRNPVVNQYVKNLKKEKNKQLEANSRVERIYKEAGEAVHRPSVNDRQSVKLPTFHKEEKKWKMKRAEKEKKQEVESAKQDAIEKYNKQKRENHKKLAKRNYKGQPHMASQMDLLLQKIQNLS